MPERDRQRGRDNRQEVDRLTILTVNRDTSRFIAGMMTALHRLTFNAYRVLVCDIDSSSQDYEQLGKLSSEHPGLTVRRKQGTEILGELSDHPVTRTPTHRALFRRNRLLAGSLAHGAALNEMLSSVDTEYTVIVDPDCIVLKKHWDDYLIDQLTQHQVKVIGVAQPHWNASGPTDFPSVTLLLFETDPVRQLGIDFRPIRSRYLDRYPGIKKTLVERFPDYQDLLNRVDSNDERFFFDVGWHLRMKCLDGSIPYRVIPSTPGGDALPGCEFPETYYAEQDVLAAHHGKRGCALALRARARSPLRRSLSGRLDDELPRMWSTIKWIHSTMRSSLLRRARRLIRELRNRRNTEENFREFKLLVEANSEAILVEFSARWLISICDTYADYGDDIERRNAFLLSLFVNMIRMSDTYRKLYKGGVSEDALKVLKRQQVPLYDGLFTLGIDDQDTCLNLSKRMTRLLAPTPLFLAMYKELITRLSKETSLIADFAAASARPHMVFPLDTAIPDGHGIV